MSPVDASSEGSDGDPRAEGNCDGEGSKRRRVGERDSAGGNDSEYLFGRDNDDDKWDALLDGQDDEWDNLFDGFAGDEHGGDPGVGVGVEGTERWIGADGGGVHGDQGLRGSVGGRKGGPGEGVPGVPAPHGAARPEGRRQMTLLPKPVEPTRLQRERHEVSGHVTYEAWCECCVRSGALDAQHRGIDPDERRGTFPTVAVDFCVPGQEDTPVAMPVLVMKDEHHGCTRARGLLTKALTDDRGARLTKRLVDKLDDTGFRRVILKSYNEPVLEAMHKRIKAASDVEIVPQHSIVRQRASNGMVENAIREVEGQNRTMTMALESRLRARVPPDARVLFWLIEHAAELLDRCKVDLLDGCTARERRYGKRDRLPWVEFGESVNFLPVADGPRLKMEPKLEIGIWVGVTLDRMLTESLEARVWSL